MARICCNICSLSLSSPSGLRRHLKDVHKLGEQFPCSECSYSTSRKARLRQHSQTKHSSGDDALAHIPAKEETRKTSPKAQTQDNSRSCQLKGSSKMLSTTSMASNSTPLSRYQQKLPTKLPVLLPKTATMQHTPILNNNSIDDTTRTYFANYELFTPEYTNSAAQMGQAVTLIVAPATTFWSDNSTSSHHFLVEVAQSTSGGAVGNFGAWNAYPGTVEEARYIASALQGPGHDLWHYGVQQ
ncbi:hypothetical protein BGZ60DRAFT_111633 [Tricladium varicosporioides]|nr:hypothetical protein BGZ60DRAFT_111633 [Hymenoscyphus varicosporioides]